MSVVVRGRYGWCRDVRRSDDKVTEGGTKVEGLEDRVGITVAEDGWYENSGRKYTIEGAQRRTKVFPNFTGGSWKGKHQRRGELGGNQDASHAHFRNQTASHRRWRWWTERCH